MLTERIISTFYQLDRLRKLNKKEHLTRAAILFSSAALGIEATTPLGYSTLTLLGSVPATIGFGVYYIRSGEEGHRWRTCKEYAKTVAYAAGAGSLLYYDIPHANVSAGLLPFFAGAAIISSRKLVN